MKKISLNCLWAMAAVLCLTITSTFAQGQHRSPRGKAGIEKMQSVIDLTDEQAAELETLQEEHRAAMQNVREQDFESPEDRRAAMKDLMKGHKADVEALLTAEQIAQLEQHKAERETHRAERKEEMKAMHKALKAYHQENIHPVMLEQRAKLDEKISAADKATIDELRTVFAKAKEQMTEMKAQYKGQGRRGEGAKEGFRALMKEQQDEKETLRALVEKYKDDIKALHEEIEPQRQQWDEDIKAIKEEYLGDNPRHDKQRKQRRHHKGDGHQGKGKRQHATPGRKAGHFLLLDPAAATDTETETALAEAELNAYPNPTVSNSTLNYEVKTAGRVRIVLSDEQGNVLKTLIDGYQDAGSYMQEVDLSGLRNGSYYYTLTDKQGVRTQKIVLVD